MSDPLVRHIYQANESEEVKHVVVFLHGYYLILDSRGHHNFLTLYSFLLTRRFHVIMAQWGISGSH